MEAAALLDGGVSGSVLSLRRAQVLNNAPLLHRTSAHLLARAWGRGSESTESNPINIWWTLFAVAGGVLIWVMPTPAGLSVHGQHALAICAATALLWVTEAIPIPLTGLVACAALTVTGVATGPMAFYGFAASLATPSTWSLSAVSVAVSARAVGRGFTT